MSTLDGLKLSAAKKPAHIPAIVFRRNKLSTQLWQQIQLAKSQIDGTTFAVKKFRTVKDKETGVRKSVEVNKRLREWWFKNEQGKVCVAIKYGSRLIELAKGKHSVECENVEGLVKALTAIKSAVEAGELDTQIATASMTLRKGFNKQALVVSCGSCFEDDRHGTTKYLYEAI